MTIPTEVLDRIRDEARKAADVYCDANGISMMSVGWSAYRDAMVSCKLAEWEREQHPPAPVKGLSVEQVMEEVRLHDLWYMMQRHTPSSDESKKDLRSRLTKLFGGG